MFKNLFKSNPKPASLVDYQLGCVQFTPAIPVLSEHQRMRRELFAKTCPDNGVAFAEEVLAAFDKAFPDLDEQVVRLPRPRPDGCIYVGDIESQLDAAGVKYVPWNYVR